LIARRDHISLGPRDLIHLYGAFMTDRDLEKNERLLPERSIPETVIAG